MKRKLYFMSFLLSMILLLFTGCNKISEDKKEVVNETITVVDQLGRTVVIPKDVKRIVCLHHHTLDIILELQQGDKLVGIVDKWESLIGSYISKVYPKLETLPTPGGLNEINIEAIAELKPDVVFFAHQLPKEYIKKLDELGIPAVGISLYVADREQASTINPELVNPDLAYTEGMKEGLQLIGKIVNSEAKAKELWETIEKSRNLVTERMKDIKEEERIKVYMINPNMKTYGTGKYVGAAMNRAGAKNVAEEVKGYATVNMEQVTKWNPDVLFVQSRYHKLLSEIKNDPAWQEISGVKNNKLLLAPDYVKPWGHPCPESMALGELWLAKTLYPDRFSDINLEEKVEEFYTNFYGVSYAKTK